MRDLNPQRGLCFDFSSSSSTIGILRSLAEMSQALWQAAPLKPEIRLSQALSEFSLVLSPKRQVQFKVLKSHQPPSFSNVIELTNEIARDGIGKHRSAWVPKFSPRLQALLHRIQIFGQAGDILIGGSQNMIASGVWACVRLSLQVRLNPPGLQD